MSSVTRWSWRSVVGARYWLQQVKTMIISSMGGCSSCRELGWIIPILHGVQPSCLTPILAKVLYIEELLWGTIQKSALILAETAERKSQGIMFNRGNELCALKRSANGSRM